MKRKPTAEERKAVEPLAEAMLLSTGGECLLCGRMPAMGSIAWRPVTPYDRLLVQVRQGDIPVVVVPLCPRCHFLPDVSDRVVREIRARLVVLS